MFKYQCFGFVHSCLYSMLHCILLFVTFFLFFLFHYRAFLRNAIIGNQAHIPGSVNKPTSPENPQHTHFNRNPKIPIEAKSSIRNTYRQKSFFINFLPFKPRAATTSTAAIASYPTNGFLRTNHIHVRSSSEIKHQQLGGRWPWHALTP